LPLPLLCFCGWADLDFDVYSLLVSHRSCLSGNEKGSLLASLRYQG